MKIAFVGQKGIPAKIGGVERYVEEVAVRLAARGNDVVAYVRNNYTDRSLQSYQGVRLVHLPSLSTKNLDAITHTLLSVMHIIFTGYDVVHFNSIGPASLAFLVKMFRPKTMVVATFQCQDYYHQKWNLFARAYLRWSEKITCTVPDRTIVVSSILQGYVAARYRRHADLIPNGADRTPTKRFDQLAQWNLTPQGYILSVSRLIRHKGIHYLIEAFKQLEDAGQTHGKKLVIAGDGFHTDQYVQELHLLASGRDSIIFTGQQDGVSLQQLFSHAAVFVQPSETEGLSLALLEAMAYGLPILASDIPENLEAVQGVSEVFESKNITHLAATMKHMIADPAYCEQLGAQARSRAEALYAWDKIVDQIEEVYRRNLARSNESIHQKA